MRSLSLIALVGSVVLAASPAWATDTDAARDELRAGYALKQTGDCHAALPHLLASYGLDPKPKAVLNAADCEQRLGDLVSARVHAVQGLALARRGGDAELTAVAEGQLADIEKRIAQLTIVPIGGVAAIVLIDGMAWDSSAPTYLNPGSHTITVRASGRADRSYPMTLGEGAHERIEVTVGGTLDQAPPVARTPARHDLDPAGATAEHRGGADGAAFGTRKIVALSIGGAGLVAVVVGGGFGLAAISKNGESNSNGHCDAAGCDPTGKQLRNDALSDASASTWLVGLGLVAVAGGVVLYMTTPSDARSSAQIEVLPLAGPALNGLGLRGAW